MALAATAGLVAAGAYLNGKYQLVRDSKIYIKTKRAERAYAKAVEEDRLSPWYQLAETCARQPKDRAIWTREREWTYQELHDQTVRYAQWLLDQGIKPGDLVSIYLHNSAEFVMLMFATLCIGAGAAMINYNLEGKALMHCLNVAESKLLIVDVDEGCQKRVRDSRGEIEAAGAKIVTFDESLKRDVSARKVVVPPDTLRNGMTGNWPFALIYTSGTTGLPKGCPFTVGRVWLMGSQLEPAFGFQRGKDSWYCPMPLYHGTGLITTTIHLMTGVGCAIVPRFSVKNFWPDVHDSRATAFIYVGETARYLLAAPAHPLERDHNLRLCYGNGLRPDVWHKFQQRFNIPEVAEFFNSSEGVFGLLVWSKNNYYNACVGHHGLIYRRLLQNVYVPVRVDADTGDIWRDPKTGFAERMPYNVGGEMLVAVPSKEAFGGYWRNQQATDKRFAYDVFQKGDLYYRSGDALRRSDDGHWYFLDRLGDTFRWKSENVSTAEVAETLGRFPGVSEANVYGVTVPGHEGRAGCVALHLQDPNPSPTFFSELLAHSRQNLPKYAVPLFLRIVKHSSHIHNHKQNKVGLRQEGVDPELLGTLEKSGAEDVFMWLNPETNSYERFGRRNWSALTRGEMRL